MSAVLVTGGAGFIGSHVSRALCAMGHRVTVVDDLSGGFVDNLDRRAEFVKADVCDHAAMGALFAERRFEYVYHLAAYAAEGLSHFIKRYNYTNNLIGSVNLINESIRHGTKCFVFTSSIAVYGPGQTPMREDAQPEPEDPYGVAKFAVELELRASQKMFGLPYVIFRPHNVYGEFQNIGDKYRNVIGIFMNQSMRGEPMTIFGDGSQTRAFSYIDDVAPVIARSAFEPKAYNQVFNIGGDVPYAVLQLARVVAAAMGAEPNIRFLEARKEVLHAFSDHSKVRGVFGPSANVSLEAGVRRMAVWAKSVGPRESKEFDAIELDKNMPASWRRVRVGTQDPAGPAAQDRLRM